MLSLITAYQVNIQFTVIHMEFYHLLFLNANQIELFRTFSIVLDGRSVYFNPQSFKGHDSKDSPLKLLKFFQYQFGLDPQHRPNKFAHVPSSTTLGFMFYTMYQKFLYILSTAVQFMN